MGKNRWILLVVLVWVSFLTVNAQDRYIVFYTDKSDSNYRISAPEEFLSDRSIQRRLKNNIQTTEQDLPVNSTYIQGIIDQGIDVFFSSKWMNASIVQMNSSDSVVIAGLSYVKAIEVVGEESRLSHDKTPYIKPTIFKEPGIVTDSKFQLALIGADEMHEEGFRGEGIYIAVFDNGFRGINEYTPFRHLFEDDLIVGMRDFIRNSGNVFQFGSHGSGVLSTIAADYGDTLTGTAPRASFVLCVTEDTQEYRIEEYNWLIAAEYADSLGVDVINSSVGYSDGFTLPSMDYTYEDMDGQTTIISQAAQMASDRGMVVVTSAGNSGSSSWKYITAPADAKDIIAVGSITDMGARSSFSSFGPTADGRIKPDVSTLGSATAIFTAVGDGFKVTYGSGTSFASPQIAGLAAGLLQANSDWTSSQLINNLKFTSSQTYEPDNELGYGIPNYQSAMNGAVLDAGDIFSDKLKVYPNPFKDNTFYIHFEDFEFRGPVEISVYDERGSLVFKDKISNRSSPEDVQVKINSSVAGIYYLKLSSRKFEKTVKLIKE